MYNKYIFIFLNPKLDSIINIEKCKIKINDNTIKYDFLYNNIKSFFNNNNIKYNIYDILKYNDKTDTIQIIKNMNINNPKKCCYLTSINIKNNIYFDNTIKGFHNLNSIYIILIPNIKKKLYNNTTKKINTKTTTKHKTKHTTKHKTKRNKSI